MKKIIVGIFSLIVLLCILIGGYFVFYRLIDQKICYQRVAKSIGVEASYTSIASYIESNLTPGMTPEEVDLILERIGPVHHGVRSPNEIRVEMCSHPLNNIILFTQYSGDGTLESIKFDDF
jgi:hypothetical protein